MATHQNNGACDKCAEIMNRYSGIDDSLKSWFIIFQAKHPEAHISCAGRGYKDQMEAHTSGASKATYGKSSHNFNCAIDIFVNQKGLDIYDEHWFMRTVPLEVPSYLEWYGWPAYKRDKSKFWELPHIEVKAWRELKDAGLIHLVEPIPA